MAGDHPDAQLFPHATGAADAMVKAHQKEEPLKLYSGWVSLLSSSSEIDLSKH